jgi:CRISPR-associated protein Cas5 subtype I-B
MKSLILEISFSEAFFKVHYTKGFRLTYPIPLPTTVAGIFGALLGIERWEVKSFFKDFLFGAKLIKYESLCSENVTFLQYKSKGIERGVVQTFVLNNPTYLIALSTEDEKKIVEIKRRLEDGAVLLPYGGQNDFFVENWKIKYVDEVEKNTQISNYAPQDFVESFKSERNTEIFILPVMHTLSQSKNFFFIFNGYLNLKTEVFSTKKDSIALYSPSFFSIWNE